MRLQNYLDITDTVKGIKELEDIPKLSLGPDDSYEDEGGVVD